MGVVPLFREESDARQNAHTGSELTCLEGSERLSKSQITDYIESHHFVGFGNIETSLLRASSKTNNINELVDCLGDENFLLLK